MKLFKYKTNKSFSELISIFENVPLVELESIFTSSKYFQHFDFTDNNGKSGFFAVLTDVYQSKIESFLTKYEISFQRKDISKDVFFDNQIDCNFVDESNNDITDDLTKFIKNFKENFTTTDDVLDKILEKGVESLSEFDKNILTK
jgi:hypothetical protein